MTKDLMKTQLIGLASHLNKIINRVNGDDFSPSLIDEIKNSLKALDNIRYTSKDANTKHLDKILDDFSVYEVKVYEEVLKEPKKRV